MQMTVNKNPVGGKFNVKKSAENKNILIIVEKASTFLCLMSIQRQILTVPAGTVVMCKYTRQLKKTKNICSIQS